jgi:L-ascorbate metabolism protein UlaG (beta-lactamase superfamily)
MNITKYEHACITVSLTDNLLVIDPGEFLVSPDFTNVTAVVITHEHADHWSPDQLRRILESNPDAKVFAPRGMAAAASDFEIHVVQPGDVVEAGEFSLRFFGGEHAVIHESIPVVDNLGVLVNDELYWAGDSYTEPGVPVGTLAVPIGGPWIKVGEAMDYVLAIAPSRAFYVHDMHLSVAGKDLTTGRVRWATEQGGGEFFDLEPYDTLYV